MQIQVMQTHQMLLVIFFLTTCSELHLHNYEPSYTRTAESIPYYFTRGTTPTNFNLDEFLYILHQPEFKGM